MDGWTALPITSYYIQFSFSITAAGTGTGMVSPNKASGTVSLSPARVPEVDPIDAAAHLQLLGESLSLIGHRLQETEVHFHMYWGFPHTQG